MNTIVLRCVLYYNYYCTDEKLYRGDNFFMTDQKQKNEKKKLPLLPRLLIGIAVGILLGSIGNIFGISEASGFVMFVRAVSTFTSLYSTFLNFTIPLLILSFVSVGLAELGQKAGKLFGITLLLAYLSTIIAGFVSFALGKAILPGIISEITGKVAEGTSFDPIFTIEVDPVMSIMTALILSFVLGLCLAVMHDRGDTLFDMLNDLKSVVIIVLEKVIIPLIPYYIAGSFCKIAASGELAPTISMFAELFIMIIILQWAYILFQFIVASLFRGENHVKDLRNIVPAYFTALGTQSSVATIPVNLECSEKNGISDDVRNFVIPLCATIHLAGDTICLTLGSMGILLASGIMPTAQMYIPFVLMLGITMVAAPGVPGGGVMAALGIIKSMLGFTDGMSELIIALHLSQDSFGTAANITGDQAIALIVDKFDAKYRKGLPAEYESEYDEASDTEEPEEVKEGENE